MKQNKKQSQINEIVFLNYLIADLETELMKLKISLFVYLGSIVKRTGYFKSNRSRFFK